MKLISCSADDSIRVWDENNGDQILRMQEHKFIVNSCCSMGNGFFMCFSGGDEGEIKVN